MDLLERLTQTAGVPGREQRVRELILNETRDLFDETRVDALGSLVCRRGPRPPAPAPGSAAGQTSGPGASGGRPLKVMLAAHMDQIGFLVRHIDDKGFVRVNPLGGFDNRNLFARLVTVCTDEGDVPGVMNPGGRPIHIATEEDKKKVPEIKEFVIDMGLSADEVRRKVKIGDMVVLRAPFTRVGKTVAAQALDNRFACWCAIRALQQLKEHRCEIYCVFTVQEEIGCKGAGAAAWDIRPDIAISLDVTLAVDTPGVPEEERVTRMGDGAGLMVMDSSMISDLELLREFEQIASEHNIKCQRSILPRGGNDGATIQVKAAGHRVLTLVCPTRYIHTASEMVHVDDLFACRDLLAAYLGGK